MLGALALPLWRFEDSQAAVAVHRQLAVRQLLLAPISAVGRPGGRWAGPVPYPCSGGGGGGGGWGIAAASLASGWAAVHLSK